MSDRDPLQTLWKSQPEEGFTMSLAEIHTRAQRFQSRIRIRNWIEYGAGAIVVLAFLAIAAWTPDTYIRIAVGLIVVGVGYISWKLATLAGATRKDDAQSWADFHCAELRRQHKALSSVWRWYLAPLAPGVGAFILASAFSATEGDIPVSMRVGVAIGGFAWVAAVFCGVAWINARAAKKIEREIAALDRARVD